MRRGLLPVPEFLNMAFRQQVLPLPVSTSCVTLSFLKMECSSSLNTTPLSLAMSLSLYVVSWRIIFSALDNDNLESYISNVAGAAICFVVSKYVAKYHSFSLMLLYWIKHKISRFHNHSRIQPTKRCWVSISVFYLPIPFPFSLSIHILSLNIVRRLESSESSSRQL